MSEKQWLLHMHTLSVSSSLNNMLREVQGVQITDTFRNLQSQLWFGGERECTLSSRVNFFLLSCGPQHQQIRLWHQNNGSVNVCLVHWCRRTNVSVPHLYKESILAGEMGHSPLRMVPSLSRWSWDIQTGSWASHREQVSMQCSSRDFGSASVPASSSCPAFLPG